MEKREEKEKKNTGAELKNRISNNKMLCLKRVQFSQEKVTLFSCFYFVLTRLTFFPNKIQANLIFIQNFRAVIFSS